MSLAPGTRIGAYEVGTQIGAGGMGEVYQARDTILGRDVALKILPDAFAHDPERLARFRREAQVLASLNHPNIAHVHGFEERDGIHALVMELVAGPTLAEVIEGGYPEAASGHDRLVDSDRAASRRGSAGAATEKSRPETARAPRGLKIDDAIGIARQIADALEAAHEQGIVHRDLKPANVKVRTDGTVKVLDFGLAKAMDPAETGTAGASRLSAVTSPAMTGIGVVLGTAAYMSPEQARGATVDRRADIWAFGGVLYEMLAGTRAFQGDTTADVLAAVLASEPDWSRLPATTPPEVRRLIRRCLQKDPHQRLQAIGDARIAIDDVRAGALPPGEAPPRPARAWRRLAVEALGALAIAAAVALVTWNAKPSTASAPPVRAFTITLAPGQQLAGLDRPALAFSDDGSQLAYVATAGTDGGREVYVRAMDTGATSAIAGTEGASSPFFSPDGQWLGFFAGGRLQKVPLKGGAAVTLTDLPIAFGAAWSNRHTIVFGTLWSVLEEIPDTPGGEPRALTRFAGTENAHLWPHFGPDGQPLLFTSGGQTAQAIAVDEGSADRHHDLIAGPGVRMPSAVESGHLVYLQGRNLMAAPFDPVRRQVDGDPILAVPHVRQYAVSANGSLAYVSGEPADSRTRLAWVSRTGARQVIDERADNYYQPRLDPTQGNRVAMDLNGQVWLFDLSTHNLAPFTFGDVNQHALWTRDGERLIFMTQKGRTWQISSQRADGSGGPEPLASDAGLLDIPYSLAPDGSLAFVKYSGTAASELWVLPPPGPSGVAAQPKRLFTIPIANAEAGPAFSPDGRWLALAAADGSGRRQIYVQAYPGPGDKHQVSIDGGNEPVWNPAHRDPPFELFYRNGDDMMAVEITTRPAFTQGRPHRLFSGAAAYQSVVPNYVRPNYDVSPDGQRFLMLESVGTGEAPLTQIHVVLNWSEALRRLAPPAK